MCVYVCLSVCLSVCLTHILSDVISLMLKGKYEWLWHDTGQIIKGSKNISIKMLKDVGMTVPKSRETSAVYMQQDRG